MANARTDSQANTPEFERTGDREQLERIGGHKGNRESDCESEQDRTERTHGRDLDRRDDDIVDEYMHERRRSDQ